MLMLQGKLYFSGKTLGKDGEEEENGKGKTYY